jgi:hypothetical protein
MKIKIVERNLENYLKQDETKVFSCTAEIDELSCYVTINEVLGYLEIEVMGIEGDPFTLTDSTFEKARSIDCFLDKLDVNFIESPFNDPYCITPEFYPQIWD